ncbi:MAG TPA: hypothetical protein P5014_02415, partial [Patescibacteria group bacterium]|nr:hypothetical protein [bacterium]HRY56996.1 hypothetical protein [Patescibacteria group bacterium]
MLEKLLPSIFKKKIRSNLNQENQQRNLSNDNKESVSLDSNFNLISKSQKLYIAPKFASEFILIIRKFIVGISVIFGVLLILNFTLSFMIQYQKGWQSKLVEEIQTYSDIEEKAKRISDKTVMYKKFLSSRFLISDKVDYVIDNIGSEIELSNLDISQQGFSISISGKDAIDFTNLIVRYLEDGLVSEIVINSASLDKSENIYKVMLRGNFK